MRCPQNGAILRAADASFCSIQSVVFPTTVTRAGVLISPAGRRILVSSSPVLASTHVAQPPPAVRTKITMIWWIAELALSLSNGRPRLRISSYGLDFVAQALLPVLFVLPLAFCPPLL
jgi:hypothetical protein